MTRFFLVWETMFAKCQRFTNGSLGAFIWATMGNFVGFFMEVRVLVGIFLGSLNIFKERNHRGDTTPSFDFWSKCHLSPELLYNLKGRQLGVAIKCFVLMV